MSSDTAKLDQQPRPPFRCLATASFERRLKGKHEHLVLRNQAGAELRLSAAEFALAQLFDGQRNAAARVDASNGRADEAAMERLALRLAEAGLLKPGRREPLPVPPQTDAEATWAYGAAATAPSGFPPSTAPGSLAAPGGPGAISGLFGVRGAANPLKIELDPRPWMPIGAAVNLTLTHPTLRWIMWVLAVIALFAFWSHRNEASLDALPLLGPFRLLILAAFCSTVVNVLGQSARAHAVRSSTHEMPRFGLNLRWGFLPQLYCDTEGPAERASTRARVRIIGSTLNACLLLFVVAIYGWLILRRDPSALPTVMLGLAGISMISLLFRANPLAHHEGYYLLAHKLGMPDLSDRARVALLGYGKPWDDRPEVARAPLLLYMATVVLFWTAVLTLLVMYPAAWLERLFGGTGILIFLGVMAYVFFEQYRRNRSGRGRIGSMKLSKFLPSRTGWIVIGIVIVLGLIPYPYEPSGSLVILPKDRADTRALIAGDVREVFVSEGAHVDKGQEIARLSDAAQKALVATTEAKLKRLEAELALARLGAREEEIALAEQHVKTARVRVNFANAEERRMNSAYQRKAVAIQDYERAKGTADVQQEELAEAQSNLTLVKAPTREESIAALEAEIDAEKAQLEYARQQLEYTRIRAPIAGTVVSDELMFAIGQYYEVGGLIATIEETGTLMAEVKLPESSVGSIEAGTSAAVKVWAFPGTTFRGTVTAIAPNAEQGEYGKIVRVLMTLDDPDHRLRPEMTGQAKIYSGWYPSAYVFTRAIVRFLLIEVWSWLP